MVSFTFAPGRTYAQTEWAADDWRAWFDERAAIGEHDGGLPRPVAEARALDACIDLWIEQHAHEADTGTDKAAAAMEAMAEMGVGPGARRDTREPAEPRAQIKGANRDG